MNMANHVFAGGRSVLVLVLLPRPDAASAEDMGGWEEGGAYDRTVQGFGA